jgi:hypothetical protein
MRSTQRWNLQFRLDTTPFEKVPEWRRSAVCMPIIIEVLHRAYLGFFQPQHYTVLAVKWRIPDLVQHQATNFEPIVEALRQYFVPRTAGDAIAAAADLGAAYADQTGLMTQLEALRSVAEYLQPELQEIYMAQVATREATSARLRAMRVYLQKPPGEST